MPAAERYAETSPRPPSVPHPASGRTRPREELLEDWRVGEDVPVFHSTRHQGTARTSGASHSVC